MRDLEQLDILQQVTKRKSDLRLYDELGKGLVGELDYTILAFDSNRLEAHSPFPSIRVPRVFQHLTQKRLLTMEWMAGENPKELLAKCNTNFENESQYSKKQRIDAKRHLFDLISLSRDYLDIIEQDCYTSLYSESQA
nr:aminoglycoside phosphotransferase [Tanacetum cinerariifolium]